MILPHHSYLFEITRHAMAVSYTHLDVYKRQEYHRIMVKCTSCGAEFETGSTSKELRVDTCSNCHPFYTGRQRFAAAQGRIEKFNKKYGLK